MICVGIGETIFSQGVAGHYLYVLQVGLVRIFVNSMNGHETSINLLGQPGQQIVVLDVEALHARAAA